MAKRIRVRAWLGLLLGTATIASSALPAAAAPPPDVFKDARGNVYVIGTVAQTLASDASARIQTDQSLTRRVRAGYCGEVRLATSSTLPSIGDSWTINGQTRTRAALPSITSRELLPRCSGNAFAPALDASTTTAGGYIDNTASVPRVFLVGYSPGISYDVDFNDVNSSQAARPNQCGFYRLSNTEANPLPSTLTISGTNYTVSSLTVADPPLCQRGSSGQYVRYNPMSWN